MLRSSSTISRSSRVAYTADGAGSGERRAHRPRQHLGQLLEGVSGDASLSRGYNCPRTTAVLSDDAVAGPAPAGSPATPWAT